MLQRIPQDQRVTGDEHNGQRQQQPPASEDAVVSFMSSIHWLNVSRLLAAWGRRKDKLQVTDSHRAALDNAQTCFAEDGDDFDETDVTMTVKMSDDASLLRRGSSEIDGQH